MISRATLCCSLAIGATLAMGAPSIAQDASMSLARAGEVLATGAYVWRDDDPADGTVSVIVSLASQRAYVLRGNRLIGVASVSTGKPGKATPIGEFGILQKRVWHRSNLYSNAPMPYMQRLTWDGIALHAGHNPGRPASHGCIRLPRAFAILLYGVTRLGTPVAVVGADGVPVPPPDYPLLVADLAGFTGDGYAEVTWLPGPLAGIAPDLDLAVSDDAAIVPDAPLIPPVR